MSDRPILFTAPDVRAILDGRKTQTRELIGEYQQVTNLPSELQEDFELQNRLFGQEGKWIVLRHPMKYNIGDRLWCRETWQSTVDHDDLIPSAIPVGSDIQYPATYDGWVSRKRSPIQMPRWASRITLIVTGVKVERLQDFSEEDAKAEGVWSIEAEEYSQSKWCSVKVSRIPAFAKLWDELHGLDSWEENLFVAAISFRTIKANIDALEAKPA